MHSLPNLLSSETSAAELHTQHHTDIFHNTEIIPSEPKEEPSESRLHHGAFFSLFCKYLLWEDTVSFVVPAEQCLCVCVQGC